MSEIIDHETGETIAPTTDIVTIDNVSNLLPAVAFAPGGIDAILAKIRAEVMAIDTDISTEKGRRSVASLAYKVARSKTAIDAMGKQLKEDAQKTVNAVDADRKKARDELDKLGAEVRKPLDDWEASEATRIADHEVALAALEKLPNTLHDQMSVGEIEWLITAFASMPERDWQEFAKRAKTANQKASDALVTALIAAQKREAEAAELERLRAEKIEREAQEEAERQRQRDEQIAAEAAEKARLEAEAKAAAEAQAQAQREAAERKRIEDEAAEAARLAEAEKQRIIDEAKAAADAAEAERIRIENEAKAAKERADDAERRRIAAEAQAEADRVVAQEQAAIATAAAVEAERKRLHEKSDEDARVQERDRLEREENKKHAAKIHNEMMRDIMTAVGLSETTAKAVVTALATKKIRHTRVTY